MYSKLFTSLLYYIRSLKNLIKTEEKLQNGKRYTCQLNLQLDLKIQKKGLKYCEWNINNIRWGFRLTTSRGGKLYCPTWPNFKTKTEIAK